MKKLLLSLLLVFPLTRCGPNCGTGKVRAYYDLQEVNVVAAHVVRVNSPSGSSSLIFRTWPPEGRYYPIALPFEWMAP